MKFSLVIWALLFIIGVAYAVVGNDPIALLIGIALAVISVLGLATTARRINRSR